MIKSLSIILPLYNEEKRIKKTFSDIIEFKKKSKIKFLEFVLVDDGSTDNSYQLIQNFIKKYKKNNFFKLIKMSKNRGKGAALKKGVKAASAKWILTSDIDFSVSLFEIEKWLKKKYINNTNQVYFGSRPHVNSKVDSKIYRKIIGNFLSLMNLFFLRINIKDTQCGFKLYKKIIAKDVFSKIKFLGYEHDIELVLLLTKRNIKIVELPVTWKHAPFSKVNVITDSIKIFINFFLIKIKYLNS